MQKKIIKRQYNLLDSWRLFVEEGIYKPDNIDNTELKLWQQSKLLGADPFLENIYLKKRTDIIKNEIEIDSKLNLWAYENGIVLFIINDDKILLTKAGFDIEHITVEKGAFIDDKKIGLNALSLAYKTHKYSFLHGAQHYVKALQYYSTRAFPIKINENQYYLMSINHISNESDVLEEEINSQIEKYIARMNGEDSSKQKFYAHYGSGVYEISTTGTLKNTSLSDLAIINEGDNILSIFYDCDLNILFSGEKQIVKYKSNTEKKYILSPILKKNEYSLSILIEKIDSSIDLFNSYTQILNNSYSMFPNRNSIPTGMLKRIKSLAVSTVPVIYVLDGILEQIVLSIFLSSLKEYDYNHNINLDKSKGDNKGLESKIEEIEDWQGNTNKFCLHIFNIGSLNEKETYKALNSVFRKSKYKTKSIIYMNNKTYEKVSINHPEIVSAFRLNIMKINQDDMIDIKNSFVSIDSDDSYDMQNNISKSLPTKDKSYSLKSMERKAIVDALISVDYNISQACVILDISRSTLYRKIREYSIFPK